MAGKVGEPERGGLILDDHTLVEIENHSETPLEGAVLSLQPEHLALLPRAIGTWHTHPGSTANLSVGDSQTFTAWPDMLHAIVGEEETRWYAVRHGAVINAA